MSVDGVQTTAGGALGGCRRAVAPVTALIAVAGLGACGEPSAGVLAAWINVDAGVEEHQLQVYDDGRRYSIPWAPAVPGSGTQLLQLGVDPRGRGVALSGPRSTVYQSLRDGRRGVLGEGDYEGDFFFARNADALGRFFRADVQGRPLAFLPFTSTSGMIPAELRSPTPAFGLTHWAILTASNAPVLFWLEQEDAPLRTHGVVRAVAYPSALGETLSVAEPTVLANGVLEGRSIVDAASPARISDGAWCPGRTCVSPSGRVLSTMMPDEPCVLRLWSWLDADADTPVAPERVPLPAACRPHDDPWLVAQIADDVFVLDDDDRIYVADLGADTMQAVPKLGDGFVDMLVRDSGRVALFVSLSGQVVHVDASGARLLATEQTFCSLRDGLAASPSGNWVVQTCGHGSPIDLFTPVPTSGSIVRVSTLGLERYFGVTMRVLGIDDEGNVLLYSYKISDAQGLPRSLFVLTGDGQLARVDTLDDKPAAVMLYGGVLGRFAAAAID
jgi:hypothetical protein